MKLPGFDGNWSVFRFRWNELSIAYSCVIFQMLQILNNTASKSIFTMKALFRGIFSIKYS